MEGVVFPGELTTFDPGQGRKLSEATKNAVLNVLYNNLQKTIVDSVSRGTSLLLSVSDEAAQVQSLPGRAMVSIPGDIQIINLSKDVRNILINEDVYLKTSEQSVEDGEEEEEEEGVEFRKEIVLEPLKELPDNGVWNCLCTHCKTSFSRMCPVFEEEQKRRIAEKKAKKRKKQTSNYKFRKFNPRRVRVNCPICSKTITNQSLKFHMEAHEGKRYPCHSCSKTFKSPFTRTRHEKIHYNGHHKTISCPHCPKRFYTNGAFNVHLNTKHKNIERHFCGICNKGFYFLNQLELHLKSHTGDAFNCKMCSESFPSRYKLSMHNIKVHGTAKEVKGKKQKSKKKRY